MCHQTLLLVESTNMFNCLLPLANFALQFEEPGVDTAEDKGGHHVLRLPERGVVINFLLFAVYKRTAAEGGFDPSELSLPILNSALDVLETYGIPLQTSISGGSNLFRAFATHCSRSTDSALQVYSLAASRVPNLHPLAVYSSQFLHSVELNSVPDDMDAAYVRRLFMLHIERVLEFKRLIRSVPLPHCPLPYCDDTNGSAITAAWAFAAAYFLFAVTPGLQLSLIDGVMASVIDKVSCNMCKNILVDRFRMLKQDWSLVKRTI
ncbi:hypothetical protein SCHPADRAFT_935015 [Schizopora paradoxa]|uniref:Uncharacterized protein n=1 Tax=Schizopora paradoxa TaxID=27342 RepID=A0A0H2S6L2_9AGAM|nr:hypothetical protein SCHPADRAFT_935015 [Schizopora paradoxa]